MLVHYKRKLFCSSYPSTLSTLYAYFTWALRSDFYFQKLNMTKLTVFVRRLLFFMFRVHLPVVLATFLGQEDSWHFRLMKQCLQYSLFILISDYNLFTISLWPQCVFTIVLCIQRGSKIENLNFSLINLTIQWFLMFLVWIKVNCSPTKGKSAALWLDLAVVLFYCWHKKLKINQ